MTMTRIALASASVLMLSACISFGPKTPDTLLNLTATASVPAGTTINGDVASALQINEPDAPAKLAVTRVPVQIDDSNIAYVEDAVWADRPTRLFRKLLGETIRAKTGRLVIDYDDPALTPTNQLRGTLQDFGYDARTGSVRVTFDAVRDVNGSQVTTRRFTAEVPGVVAEAAPVGMALNTAANDVAGQVADWVR
jgi:cholesterol transport system auxiliary component